MGVIGAGIDVDTQAGVKIANILGAEVEALSTAGVRNDIANLVDSGVLKEDHGPMTCTHCMGAFDKDEPACPYCGAVPGEENRAPQPWIDDEMEEEEDLPVHGGQTEEIYEYVPVTIDLPKRFEELLIDLGWDEEDAENGGLIVARAWEIAQPRDRDTYRKSLETVNVGLEEKLLDKVVEDRILEEFRNLSREREEEKQRSVQCEIRIIQVENGEWSVEVDDPLQNLILTNRSGRVPLGNSQRPFSISIEWFLKLIEDRTRRLMSLGEQLVKLRRDFFEAMDPDHAEQVLQKHPLHQKDVVVKIGIPKSTLSRWCKDEGVWISTAHGAYPLSDFFRRAAKTKRDLTVDAVREIIGIARKQFSRRNQAGTLLKYLKDEHGIEMSDRTLRDYLKPTNSTLKA